MRNRTVTLADWRSTDQQIKNVNQVLKSGRLTYGDFTRDFERNFADLHDRDFAIFVNSGTSGLQVALHYFKEKYGWEDGDEVIVPAVTFVATVNVILQNRLKPVIVDVGEYFHIDPNLIQEAITDRTRCIMPVDLLGQPCEIDKIMKIAKKNKLKVIEDSCEAMFVNYQDKPVGSQADIAVYSSYLAHIISTGVGGFIVTNNKKDEEYMRSMIWHGRDNLYLNIDANDKVDKKKLLHARFKFDKPGYSYRLTELEAAIGVDELDRNFEIVDLRQNNAQTLTQLLKPLEDIGTIVLPKVRPNAESCWMFYPIIVGPRHRDKLALFLEEKGIQTRWIMPLTNQPIYKDWCVEDHYPVAKSINQCGILLGCHHFLTLKDLQYTASCIKEYFDQ